MERWTFRVDASEEITREKVVKFFEETTEEDIPKYLIYYEISDQKEKPHYQGVLFTKIKENTMRLRIKRYFGVEKGSYSFAKVRKDQYEIYITKDGDQVCKRGYTDMEVFELYDKAYVKKQKRRDRPFIEIIEEAFVNYVKDMKLIPDDLDTDETITRQEKMTRYEVCEFILEFLIDNGKWQMCNKKQVASLFVYFRLKYPQYFEHKYDGVNTFKSLLISNIMREVL